MIFLRLFLLLSALATCGYFTEVKAAPIPNTAYHLDLYEKGTDTLPDGRLDPMWFDRSLFYPGDTSFDGQVTATFDTHSIIVEGVSYGTGHWEVLSIDGVDNDGVHVLGTILAVPVGGSQLTQLGAVLALPEPSPFILLALGLAGLSFLRRR